LLFEACRNSDTETVTVLLKQGNINLNYIHEGDHSKDTHTGKNVHTGKTPLIMAISKKCPEIVRMLVANGADVNYHPTSEVCLAASTLTNICNRNSQHIVCLPLKEALFSTLEITKILVDAGADCRQGCCYGECSAVSLAIQHNLCEVLALFIETGFDVNGRTEYENIHPEHGQEHSHTAKNMQEHGHSVLVKSLPDLVSLSNRSDVTLECQQLRFMHMLCTKYGARLNQYDIMRKMDFCIVHSILLSYCATGREEEVQSDADVEKMKHELLVAIIREGLDLDKLHDDLNHSSLLEYCLCHGINPYARFFWMAGSERGNAAMWNRKNIIFFNRKDEGPNIQEQEKILLLLENVIQQPRSLLSGCRAKVRRELRPGEMSVKVSTLEIPSCLKEYLLLPELAQLIDDDVCIHCHKLVREEQRAVECEECWLWQHIQCENIMSEFDYDNIIHCSASSTHWKCKKCTRPIKPWLGSHHFDLVQKKSRIQNQCKMRNVTK